MADPVPQQDSATPVQTIPAQTLQQAKAELPQPRITPPWEEEPRLPDPPPTTRLGKAYAGLKQFLSEHEQHVSEKYLAPFRTGLDRMADDLQYAGESGHTQSGGRLTGPTRALAIGAGAALHMVPVGKDVRETAAMAVTPPELGPEGKALSRELKAGERAAEKAELAGIRTREATPKNPLSALPQRHPKNMPSFTKRLRIRKVRTSTIKV